MRSSKDIKPRVGMQVHWTSSDDPNRTFVDSRFKIAEIDVEGYICLAHRVRTLNPAGCGGDWDAGNVEIEWTPPTDEERAMFREASQHMKSANCDGDCNHACLWFWAYQDVPIDMDVFESLAMDGM